MIEYDLVVVGGGTAGLTAGLFGARYGLKTIVLEQLIPGGELVNVERIENYPGFPQGVSGADLVAQFQEHAMNSGCEMGMMASASALEPQDPYLVLKTDGEEYRAKAVIVATGSSLRRLGVPGEEEYVGRGVSSCATCDGPLFADEVVGVVGGGDSAADEAVTLTQWASKVILFHRSDRFRAQRVLQERIRENPKIEVRTNTEVTEVRGNEEGVRAVRVRDTQSGETSEVELAGLFVYVGLEPRSAFLNGVVEVDNGGHVATDISMRTRVPGVYAVGDVRRHSAAQIVAGAGDGATAAIDAARYVQGRTWP